MLAYKAPVCQKTSASRLLLYTAAITASLVINYNHYTAFERSHVAEIIMEGNVRLF